MRYKSNDKRKQINNKRYNKKKEFASVFLVLKECMYASLRSKNRTTYASFEAGFTWVKGICHSISH